MNRFITCCEREGKSENSRRVLNGDKQNQEDSDAAFSIGSNKGKICGVGINFLVEKTGALVVRSLLPEGKRL